MNKRKKRTQNGCILVFCAHNDDQVIGAGGTLAKYAKQGKQFFTYIFSYGESSHPHLKRKVTIEMRVKESLEADKVLGGSGIVYFGISEGRFNEEIAEKGIEQKIRDIIKEKNPEKIFTHSIDDPHPDHKAVYYLIKKIVDDIDFRGDVYSFDIWNPIQIRKRNLPKLVVDISETFSTKIRAFRCHRSQKVTMIVLMWNVYLKALFNGFYNHVRYAEVFSKIK